jgi:hypothetical protein
MNEARVRIARKITIDKDSGCWEWNGNARENGYCRTTYKRKNWYVHRLAYSSFVGDIPDNHDVCHKCDNRKCCNPAHLFVGTRKDNMDDARSKGRLSVGARHSESVPKGEDCYFAKLTENEVQLIRRMIVNKHKTKEIASLFNVSPDNIRRIKRNNTWRHLKWSISGLE